MNILLKIRFWWHKNCVEFVVRMVIFAAAMFVFSFLEAKYGFDFWVMAGPFLAGNMVGQILYDLFKEKHSAQTKRANKVAMGMAKTCLIISEVCKVDNDAVRNKMIDFIHNGNDAAMQEFGVTFTQQLFEKFLESADLDMQEVRTNRSTLQFARTGYMLKGVVEFLKKKYPHVAKRMES